MYYLLSDDSNFTIKEYVIERIVGQTYTEGKNDVFRNVIVTVNGKNISCESFLGDEIDIFGICSLPWYGRLCVGCVLCIREICEKACYGRGRRF